MKTLLLAATAAAFTAAASLSPASAAKLPAATPAQVFPQTVGSGSPGRATGTPHYEWQYHYAGRQPARWEGHWVLVR
jgi:hypothetical protein